MHAHQGVYNKYVFTYPRVLGETVDRIVSFQYCHNQGVREPNIDWALVKEMGIIFKKEIIEKLPISAQAEPQAHINDMNNEALPERVRMHHADIMFAQGWNAHMTFGAEFRSFDSFIAMGLDAGLQ